MLNVHELSICSAIARTAQEHAGGRAVRRIRLRVGHFRQVVPGTLAYCWELQTRGGPLEGCALDVEHVPAVIRCRSCGADTTLEHPVLVCGSCGGTDVALVSGEEFLIESIDVAEPVDVEEVS